MQAVRTSTPRTYEQYSPSEVYEMVRHASPQAIAEIAQGMTSQQFNYVCDLLQNPEKVQIVRTYYRGILTNKA